MRLLRHLYVCSTESQFRDLEPKQSIAVVLGEARRCARKRPFRASFSDRQCSHSDTRRLPLLYARFSSFSLSLLLYISICHLSTSDVINRTATLHAPMSADALALIADKVLHIQNHVYKPRKDFEYIGQQTTNELAQEREPRSEYHPLFLSLPM
ncbi:hypothetical protein BC827DRAFT_124497 [Russula dissimulans]|nr:hypothetical protein BC827DRAFT_124497 [Russula dissimulans]